MARTIFKILLLSVFSFILKINSAQKFEAEDATLLGGATIETSLSASGGKFVAQKGGSLTFTVSIEEDAWYDVYITAAAPGGKKTNILAFENGDIGFTFQQNSAFVTIKAASYIKLKAGEHTVKILNSWGWINIDYIEFTTVDPSERFNVQKTLVTPNPSDHTQKLYQFIYDNYGKKIISGAMNDSKSLNEVQWLKNNTGKEPVIAGIDFLFSGRNYNWYNDERPIIDAGNWYKRNGIPAMCWHWRDPSRKTEAFYTKDTDFDISRITDTTSAEYIAMVKDIDYIAGLLKKLRDSDVPVLWRPLHEASGGWFWWGAKGAEPCKKLWRLMFDRMVHYHGLNNLIWVWTSQQNDLDWYPGDEYVDLVGRDIYKEGDHSSQMLEFNRLNDDYGGKKIITLSECGSFPDADKLFEDEVPWSYFMPWNGDFIRDSKYNSLEFWKKTLNHEYVLTLDEMPDLKSYTTPPPGSWRSKLYPENWKPGYSDGQGRFLHDFSYAGYHQGEKEIPFIESNIVDVTQPPYNADNTGTTDATAAIQKALNDVGQAGGGVVYLPAGTYKVNPGNGETALRMQYSNTVLRGAGPDSTFIFNSTSSMRQKNIILLMGDWCTWANTYGNTTKLKNDLLFPTRIIPVQSTEGFKKGDDIILRTDGTPAFIEEHRMSGIWEDWAARVMFLRKIDSIDVENNLVYIDSPTRYFMKIRDNARIYHAKKHITECGIENLSIGNLQSEKQGWAEESYSTPGTGAYDVHTSHAIYVKYAQNCWIKKVNSYHPGSNSGDFHLLSNGILLEQSRNVTVDSCFFQKPQYEGGGGNGYMFTLSSNDCLIQNCRANDARHNYDFKHAYSNGNVIYNCLGENSKYASDFHMYLSMANLIDNFTVNRDYLESTFRPYGGSVIHGYSSTQSVFYNTKGIAYHSNKQYIIESRQFGHGYIIGTSGAANKVLLDPVQGTTNGYAYNGAPRDFAEGIGDGENLFPKSLYLDQLQRRMQDSSALPEYRVTIRVLHNETGEPLPGCSVQLMNRQQQTDEQGTAHFEKANNVLIVNAAKSNFYPLTNLQYMIFSDTTLTLQMVPQEYDITIVVRDRKTGQTFEGTPVTFNNETEVTNSQGEAYFKAYQGTFNYSVTKSSYHDITGMLEVNSDTTIHFYLEKSDAFIKFKIREQNGTTPVSNATVVLNDDTLKTTGLGIANFKDLELGREYSFLIFKGGYNDISGSLFLENDTTVILELIAYPVSAINLESDKIKIWPNPAHEALFVEIPSGIMEGELKILNPDGSVLKKVGFNSSGKISLPLSGLASGSYILTIESREIISNHIFLKQTN